MATKKKLMQSGIKKFDPDFAITLDNADAYTGGSATDENFGKSVGASSNYVICGARSEDETSQISSGKAYIFNASTGALLHTLDNPNTYQNAGGDTFGTSVAISDSYAIVGAENEDDGGTSSGTAYIFNPSTGALLHTLDNPNAYGTPLVDYFGFSVAISDSYAIVGAYQEDDAGGTSSGKAYIFNASTGALLHTLDNPTAYGTSAGDEFGRAVAITDDYAIVGAATEDDFGGTNSGKVYIFDPSDGSLLRTISNPNAYSSSPSDVFGSSVAISNSYLVVGAYGEDDVGGGSSGKAYIFNPSTGALLYTLDNPNAYGTSSTDRFGYSVSVSENCVVVGAYQEDDASGNQSGKAYIFDPSDGSLSHTLDNPNVFGSGEGNRFGYSVGISDSYAIVSATYEGDAGGTESGKAYIYDVFTNQLLHTLDNPNAYNTSTSDHFGFSVAISDSYAIVGAYDEDDAGGSSSGKAYIFNPSTGALLHTLNNPNAYSTSADDRFGSSVSICDSYAIVGAYGEDDASGSLSGKAYIFNPLTGALLYTLNNPNPYSTSANDYFGRSVAITDSYAIVSAYAEDEASGGESGKAYIYNPSTGALLHTLDNPNAYNTPVGDNFGHSVDISETYAIVGAYPEDDAGGTSSGKAYIFENSTGNLLHTLDNPNVYSVSASDFFGYAVAISDSYALVGAHGEDEASGTGSGKAYIFNPSTGDLLYTLDNPNAYGTVVNDQFGVSVSISDSCAIFGLWQEDDASGDSSGKAYIFK